jgi:hypothetical protein
MLSIILLSMTNFLEKVSMISLIKLFYFFVVLGLFGVVVSLLQLIAGVFDFIF